jgi:hypothetical protein
MLNTSKAQAQAKKDLWGDMPAANRKKLAHVPAMKDADGAPVDFYALVGLKIPDVVTTIPDELARSSDREDHRLAPRVAWRAEGDHFGHRG